MIILVLLVERALPTHALRAASDLHALASQALMNVCGRALASQALMNVCALGVRESHAYKTGRICPGAADHQESSIHAQQKRLGS